MTSMTHSKQVVGSLGKIHVFVLKIDPKLTYPHSVGLAQQLFNETKEWCTNQFGTMNNFFFMSNNPRWSVTRSLNGLGINVFFTSDSDATLFKLGFTPS